MPIRIETESQDGMMRPDDALLHPTEPGVRTLTDTNTVPLTQLRTGEHAEVLRQRFDALCTRATCFESLDQALGRMHKNKDKLLRVLERPQTPLHNNLSEQGVRVTPCKNATGSLLSRGLER